MKVLVIDDDQEIREPIVSSFWKKKGATEIVWLTRWPSCFLSYLEENPDITHISLDHDLGYTDLSSELSKDIYLTPEKFQEVLKPRTIIIHSMNPVGAQNIFNKLMLSGATLFVVPLSSMKG